MPKRFTGVNVPQSGDARLVKEEIFQRTHGRGEQVAKSRRRKFRRQSIHSQRGKAGNLFGWAERIDAAEMAAICESQNAFLQFERDIDVNAILSGVGAFEQLARIPEPDELTIETKVERDQTAVKD